MSYPTVSRSARSRLSAGREIVSFYLNRPDWNEVIRPELPFGAVANGEFVQDLNNSSSYLEFGSGASTLVASESNVKRIVSIESDRDFLAAVRVQIAAQQDVNTEIDYLYADIGPTGPWGVPLFKSRLWRMRERWPNYSLVPWIELGSDFRADLVLVDGRFRVACALAVIINQADSNWKLLVDDFAERPEYFPIKDFSELVEMRGRMAVFKPRVGLNVRSAKLALQYFQRDWR